MAERRKVLHYLGIALAVFVGVLAARVVYLYIVAHVLTETLEIAAEQVQLESRKRREESARKRAAQEAIAAREKDERRHVRELQRMRSPVGRDLGRRCHEFTAYLNQNPGDYAREQRQEACRRYEIFIETGRKVEKLPPRGTLQSDPSAHDVGVAANAYDTAMVRKQTPIGQALHAQCQQQIAAFLEYASDAARTQREAACKRFARFLDTAEVAP